MQNDQEVATKPAKNGSKNVALNPVRHGILSPNPIISGMEKRRDWKAHLQGIRESLLPEGHLECELAERIALCLWQLKRVARHTVAITSDSIGNVKSDYVQGVMITHGIQAVVDAAKGERDDLPVPSDAELAGMRERRMVPASSDLDRIMRYESHLHRLVDRTLRALEALQAQRLDRPIALHRHL